MSDRAPRAAMRPSAHPETTAVSGTATVTVASRLPHKLMLYVQESYKFNEPVLGGGWRETTAWRNRGEPVVVNGTAVEFNVQRTWIMAGGYALTPNVPAEFWEKWCEQNKGSPLLENRMLFAYARQNDAAAAARENRRAVSGFEPIDASKPIRMGKGFEIKPDDSMPKIPSPEEVD